MEMLDAIVSIGLDLTAALNAKDRYQRLLESLNRIIPYDAATLLRIDNDILIPVAARGLSPEAMGRQYVRKEPHPGLILFAIRRSPFCFQRTLLCLILLTACWKPTPKCKPSI
jgi:anaerobic nitric oxide reductase transcription regulator